MIEPKIDPIFGQVTKKKKEQKLDFGQDETRNDFRRRLDLSNRHRWIRDHHR